MLRKGIFEGGKLKRAVERGRGLPSKKGVGDTSES